jgi:Holliday junction resolvase
MSAATGDMLERRTVEHLRAIGYHAERVSRRGRYGAGDLFGCVDIVAVGEEGVMLCQVTTKTNASSRRKKIRNAGLPEPVRLFLWAKNGRAWAFTSEVVAPVEAAVE